MHCHQQAIGVHLIITHSLWISDQIAFKAQQINSAAIYSDNSCSIRVRIARPYQMNVKVIDFPMLGPNDNGLI